MKNAGKNMQKPKKRPPELDIIDKIIEDYSEWIEAYKLDPYRVASIVLATRLKIAEEKQELTDYVRNSRF